MSNKLDFGRFKTIKELQNYADSQFQTILKMQAQAEAYQTKIEHLEELLRTSGSAEIVGSSELEIAKIELSRLHAHSLREPLDDKQIRSYDIYVKCLLAIQGKTPEKKSKSKEPEHTLEELIAMSQQAMPSNEPQ